MIEHIDISNATREQWLALRKNDITASVLGALWGIHPYMTPLQLAAEKLGLVERPDNSDNQAMARGRMLEGAVAQLTREDKPDWTINKAQVYLRDPEIRLGATPDFFYTSAEPSGSYNGVLQTKTASTKSFETYWPDRPPLWIVLQTTCEMMLADVDRGAIAVFVVDAYQPQFHIYEINRDSELEQEIKDKVRLYWCDITSDREPKVYYERDAAIIKKIYATATPGMMLDLRNDEQMGALLDEREKLSQTIKTATDRKDVIEAMIRHRVGIAESAMFSDNWYVTLKNQSRKEYMVKATSFRTLRAVRDDIASPPLKINDEDENFSLDTEATHGI
jgi:predicted phage-related endonuclease